MDDKTIRSYGEQALRDEAQAILDQIALLDDNFEKAVDMMYHCQGKIIVTGVGKSGHVGAKIAATLASTGTPAFYINPLDVYHGDLGVMTDKDVVLALSNSGQTDELLRFIPMVLHMNVPIISITGNPNSLLAKYSNHHITVKVKKEACPLNLAPTSCPRHGRCPGNSPDAGAPLQATRLCPVPSGRRIGQASPHHRRRRDAQRRHAYHP